MFHNNPLKISLFLTSQPKRVKPEITKRRKKLRKVRWKRENSTRIADLPIGKREFLSERWPKLSVDSMDGLAVAVRCGRDFFLSHQAASRIGLMDWREKDLVSALFVEQGVIYLELSELQDERLRRISPNFWPAIFPIRAFEKLSFGQS